MDFDQATHQRTIEALHQGLRDLTGHIDDFGRAATAVANQPGIPGLVAAAIVDIGQEIAAAARAVGNTLMELLVGALAPAYLFADALGWVDVRGQASGVAGVLRVDQLPVRDHWKGVAADRYALAVASQSGAAGKVAVAAGTASVSLGVCAAAGLAFYVALGVILARLIAALVASMAAIGSGGFSWAGFLLALEEVGFSTASIGLAVTAVSALVGTQAGSIIALRNELADASAFPGGHWPRAVVDAYSDATVTDGAAEWSFSR